MVVPFRVGAERRVYGKIARAAYEARVAARMKRQAGSIVQDVCEPPHAHPQAGHGTDELVNDVCDPPHAQTPSLQSLDDTVHVETCEPPHDRPLILQRMNPIVAVPPSLILREMKEAPGLYCDMTEDGVTAMQAVQRFRWKDPYLRSLAQTYGKVIELLPQQRRDQVWATNVCHLAACFFADLCPKFYQAQLRSAELNLGYFSYVPRKGKYGWYKRAKWAGLLH